MQTNTTQHTGPQQNLSNEINFGVLENFWKIYLKIFGKFISWA